MDFWNLSKCEVFDVTPSNLKVLGAARQDLKELLGNILEKLFL